MALCPHCGFDAGAGSAACPLCGSRLAPRAVEPGPTVPPAWEEPGRGFPGKLLDTWRASLFEPTTFFRGVGTEPPFSRPLLYFLLVAVTGAFFTLWWETLGVWPTAWVGWGEWGAEMGPLLPEPGPAAALAGFFLSPFVALFGLGVWTVILHLFVLLFVPGRRTLGATARVVCYASGPTVFSAVPFLGSVVGLVWATVLQVVGVREVHRTTTGRAAAAVLVPLALAVVLVVLAFLLLVLIGVSLLQPYVGGPA